MSVQPTKGVGFNDEYIKAQTEIYLKDAIASEKIMSPHYVMEYDGIHAVDDHEVYTPSSWGNDMLQVWILDLELSQEREDQIEVLINKVMKELLPSELAEYL